MEEDIPKKEVKEEVTHSSLLILKEIRRLQERQRKIEREIRISNSMIVLALTGIIAFVDMPVFYKIVQITITYCTLEDFREGLKIVFSNLKLFFIKKRD